MARRSSFRLSAADREELKRWLRCKGMPSGKALRARLLLALDEGRPITEIAESFHVSRPTVYQWKKRYLAEGIEGLTDRPRPGRPTVIDAKSVERILFLTTQRVPKEATHGARV